MASGPTFKDGGSTRDRDRDGGGSASDFSISREEFLSGSPTERTQTTTTDTGTDPANFRRETGGRAGRPTDSTPDPTAAPTESDRATVTRTGAEQAAQVDRQPRTAAEQQAIAQAGVARGGPTTEELGKEARRRARRGATGLRERAAEETAPLAQLALSADQRETARAGERAIQARGARGNLAARTAVGGEVIQRAARGAGEFATEQIRAAQSVSTPARATQAAADVIGVDVDVPRGAPTRIAEARVGGSGATVEQQAASAVGAAVEFPGVVAGGTAQAVGTAGVAAERAVETGRVDVAGGAGQFADLAGRGARRQGEFVVNRPVEAGIVLAGPTVASRAARGGGVGGGRTARVRSAVGEGASRARTRLGEEAARAREFASETRAQQELVGRQRQRTRGQERGETATDLRQIRPRDQGPTMRSAGVDVTTGRRPGRSGIEGQRSFAERVREFERLKRAPEPDLPPVPRVPAQARTGGVDAAAGVAPVTGPDLVGGAVERQTQAQTPGVEAGDTGPPGVEEDTSVVEAGVELTQVQDLQQRERERDRTRERDLTERDDVLDVGERPGVRDRTRTRERERGDTDEAVVPQTGERTGERPALDQPERVGPGFDTPTRTVTGGVPAQDPGVPPPTGQPGQPGRPRTPPGLFGAVPGGSASPRDDPRFGEFERVFFNPVADPSAFVTGENGIDLEGIDFE